MQKIPYHIKSSSTPKQNKRLKAGFLATAGTALALLFAQNPTSAQQNYTNNTDSLSQKKIIELVDSTDNLTPLLARDSLEYERTVNTMLEVINTYRKKYNLTELHIHPILQHTAQGYSEYCATHNRCKHEDKSGVTLSQRIQKNGWKGANGIVCENLGFGIGGEKADINRMVMEIRKKSNLHNKNLLLKTGKNIGVGISKTKHPMGYTNYIRVINIGE